MTDEQAADFLKLNLAAQRLALALDGFDLERLEFDRWRVANGRDPEWQASDRQPLFTRCQCRLCQADPSVSQLSGFVAP